MRNLRNANDDSIIKNTAYLYLRYSSKNQDEESIVYQRNECIKIAERYGIEIIGEFIDEAKSGREESIEKRKDYNRMRDIVLNHTPRPEYIICYKLDRLGRSTIQNGQIMEDFRKVGCTFITTEQHYGKENDKLIATVKSHIAEEESNNISIRTTDATYNKALKGYHMGGTTPFGYTTEEIKIDSRHSHTLLKVDESKAPIVEDIFNLYANTNATLADVAKYLNDKGIKNTQGGKWIKQTVSNLFRRKCYKGTYYYRSFKKNYDNYTYDVREIELDDKIPAIVSKETWNMVQLKLDANSKAPKTANKQKNNTNDEEIFFLTSKLYCGHCGSTMSGSSSTKKLKDGSYRKYRYYECYDRHTYKTCNKQSVDKAMIEDYVFTAIYELIDSKIEDTADKIIKVYNEKYGKKKNKSKTEKEIEKLEATCDNLIDMLANPELDIPNLKENITNKIKITNDRINKLKADLVKAESTNRLVPDQAAIISKLKSMKKAASSTIGKQQLIRAFIRAVYITDDNIVIFFNFDGDTPTPDFRFFKDTLNENNIAIPDITAPTKRKNTTKNSVSCQGHGAILDGQRNNLKVLYYTLYTIIPV